MANLFNPPPMFTLPLSKGRDLHCTFVYKPLVTDEGGDPVLDEDGNRQYVEADYPDGATVTLTIDADEPVEGAATITGSRAIVHIDSDLVDPIGKGKLWRTTLTYEDGLDIVMVNGQTGRSDGK